MKTSKRKFANTLLYRLTRMPASTSPSHGQTGLTAYKFRQSTEALAGLKPYASHKRISNFGGNVSFDCEHYYTPKNEAEVLEVLNKHADDKIRVVASLHSWSDVVKSEDVIIDMRHFDHVEIGEKTDDAVSMTLGGGRVLKHLLRTIHREADATLPTIGGVTEQTIAGAISTATHGSGKHSLSHYMDELRVAAYDAKTGKAKIYLWKDGTELRAARCGLGCMGIILSVKFRCVSQYYVTETVTRRETLEEILAEEREYPLQQIVLVPYLWSYFAYQRRRSTTKPSWTQMVQAIIYRGYNVLLRDILFHVIVKGLVSRLGGPYWIRKFYEKLYPRLVRQIDNVVDKSEHILTLKHHWFKHLEMEIFIPKRNVFKATQLVQSVTSVFAGTSETVPDGVAAELESIGMLETLMGHKGDYTHHYPIVFRLVRPDDTLISMTSDSDESYYTMSFFTYAKRRTQFYEYAGFLARGLTRLYDARLHWGKYYPLTNDEIEHLYPRLEQFRQACEKTDPNGVFRNEYAKRVLGFST